VPHKSIKKNPAPSVPTVCIVFVIKIGKPENDARGMDTRLPRCFAVPAIMNHNKFFW